MSPFPVFLEMNFIRTLSGRNAIQIKIPVGTFMGLDKLTLKAEPKKARYRQEILEGERTRQRTYFIGCQDF